jgi:NADP-dependent 3-hydroxy acid dehydrogenase YdfG
MSRLVLVTGGSSGIGAAVGRHFASDGWRVVLVARSPGKLASVAESMGPTVLTEICDVGDGSAVLGMADRVKDGLGVPDVIVNAAGAGAWKRIEETPPEEALDMIGAPYLGAFNVTHAFMADMLERGSGVLIHVGSPAAVAAWPSSVGYTASRAALRGFNEALHQDLHGTGVSTCHVVFGEVRTPYFETNAETRARMPSIGRIVPAITPEECARVIARVARRPRREVWHPLALRFTYWTHRLFPPILRILLRMTGYRPEA